MYVKDLLSVLEESQQGKSLLSYEKLKEINSMWVVTFKGRHAVVES